MFNNVFISYAKEDYQFAEKLYDFLLENNFKPWLDKKNILPGQQWDFEIKKGLREAHYVILLLSDNSVQKRGYVQREFKIALTYYEEKLEDDIYLIPIKINKCDVPESLSRFQWINFENNSLDSILNSLNIQQGRYLDYHQKQVNKHRTFEIKEVTEEFFYKNESLSINIESDYFQFVDSKNQSLSEINNIVAGKAAEGILGARSYYYDNDNSHLWDNYKGSEMNNWQYITHYSIHFLNTSIISFTENLYTYTGGAHGSAGVSGYNYFLSPSYQLNIENLFEYEDYKIILQFLSDFCFEELRKIYNEGLELTQEDIQKQDKSIFWEGSLDLKWENFDNFIISRDYLSIIFNQYQVSSYAFGIQIVDIPISEIFKLKINTTKLKRLVELMN